MVQIWSHCLWWIGTDSSLVYTLVFLVSNFYYFFSKAVDKRKQVGPNPKNEITVLL